MATRKQAVSMKAIAEQAGVSVMTVSRVLTGKGSASAKTTALIQGIAKDMKYRPNRLVRGIQTGRSGMVGVILPADLGYYKNLLVGAHDYFAAKDCGVITSLVQGNMGEEAITDERGKLHRLVDLRADGVILRPVNEEASSAYFEELIERAIPMVVVDRRLSDYKCDFVGTDDYLGGQMAAEHMLRRQPKRVLVCSASEVLRTSYERVRGFRDGLKASGVEVVEHAFGHFYAAQSDMEKVLKEQGRLDGIFCVGDMLAIRCLRILEQMGVSVPGDVGVIGFGNLGLPGDYGARLTTFEQNPHEVGRQAAKLLYSRIGQKGKSPVRQQLIAPTLVDMGTC